MKFAFPGQDVRYGLVRRRISQYDVDVRRGPRWWRNTVTALLPKLLSWLKAWPTALAMENKAHYVTIQEDSFIQGLIHSQRDLDRIWHGGFRVYAGPDTFPAIDREVMERMNPFTFMAETEMGRGGHFQVCGTPVTFVPWMKGFVLVPEPEPAMKGRRL